MKAFWVILIFGVGLSSGFVQASPEKAPSSFVFVVVGAGERIGTHGWLDMVLFNLDDIETYQLDSHSVVFKPEAKNRIENLEWWKKICRTSGGQKFKVLVGGVSAYEGRLHSYLSSSLPPPGPCVMIPFLWRDEPRIEIGLKQSALDPRGEEKIIQVFRNAGVLVE